MSPHYDRYYRQMHQCLAHADQCTRELATLWREVASSYRFLMEREMRIETDGHRMWAPERARTPALPVPPDC